LRRKPRGEKQHGYNYSDLGFYLLQKLTDQCSGMSLDRLMDSLFFKPMGMGTMTFNPLCKFPYQKLRQLKTMKTLGYSSFVARCTMK
jgi:beta-N-acetylhexosaminidase